MNNGSWLIFFLVLLLSLTRISEEVVVVSLASLLPIRKFIILYAWVALHIGGSLRFGIRSFMVAGALC